jgi:hypothetical protein
MSLPSCIKVGGFDYKVYERGDFVKTQGQFGQCDNDVGVILVGTDLTKAMQVNTLIHEIFHAIYYVYNIEEKDEEERVVNTFANGWHQVLSDNPSLVNYVKRMTK